MPSNRQFSFCLAQIAAAAPAHLQIKLQALEKQHIHHSKKAID